MTRQIIPTGVEATFQYQLARDNIDDLINLGRVGWETTGLRMGSSIVMKREILVGRSVVTPGNRTPVGGNI